MSISRIFDISRRSMAVYQRAMDVTAHNVANASNPNYSRQRVIMSTGHPQMEAGFIWGTGVKIDQVQRVRNDLTDSQIRINNEKYHDNNQRSAILSQVESLFSEPSELGLSNLISSFFNSWDELAVTPNSSALRHDVIRSAQKLSSKAQSVYEGLDLLKSDLMNEAKSKVTDLNRFLKEVQTLNAQIFDASVSGSENNDLLDKRDEVINKLSQLANINVTYDSSNSAVISLGGIFAADKTTSVEFKLSDINGKPAVVSVQGNSNTNLKGGELFAILDTYSNDITEYQNKFNLIFNSLVESVNNIHSSGYTVTNPPITGMDFFEGYSGGLLEINEEILLDPKKIAVSSDGTAGNGNLALTIAELSGQKLIDGATLSEVYSGVVSGIGGSKVSADEIAEASSLILQQLEQQKASYSGVSIDEEMTNVIKYQRSYDASAKLIKVADELIQTVLNLVG